MTDDERAIRDLVATWMKASETGDVDTVLSLMGEDVIFMVPGREPFGKDAFRTASETMKGVGESIQPKSDPAKPACGGRLNHADHYQRQHKCPNDCHR